MQTTLNSTITPRSHKDLRALLAQVEQLKTRIRLEDQEELQQMLAPLVGRVSAK